MCHRGFSPGRLRPGPWTVLLLGLAVLSCSGCGAERAGVPDIVLITVDALRPDSTVPYGGETETPGLSRLAALGTVYEDCATVCPMTRPAAATILTGRSPDRTGVRNDTSDRLGRMDATLASMLRESGRSTLGLAGSAFASYSSGFQHGFELFDGPEDLRVGPERFVPETIEAGEIAKRFAAWIESQPQESPTFVWIHLADLHGRITSQREIEPCREEYGTALRKVDEGVGAILDALEATGRLDGAAIVLAGTHGAFLGEGGARGASYWLRPETLRVPLVVKGPGFRAGARATGAVWLPDVTATVLGLAGLEPGDDVEGRDLAAGAGERSAPRRAWTWAPDDELHWPSLTAVETAAGWREFTWRELRAATESGNGGDPDLALALERPARPRDRTLPAGLADRLRDSGAPLGDHMLEPEVPEEAGRNEFLKDLQLVRHRFVQGRSLAMLKASRRMVESLPDNLGSLSHRLFVHLTGRHRGSTSMELAERLLELYPFHEEALHWAGHAYQLNGNPATGEVLIEAAIAVGGAEPEMLYDLACSRAVAGDTDAALERLEEAIEAGWRKWIHIERDSDLVTIRSDPRYAEILGRYGR